ncbi:hypothetical protein ATK17_1809 [Branchiibius hedensis]|uniref:Uncharacterized protein n=1 Tax=Branchiibius hedensis TaxID=672460 RepID=A0A2Y8ZSP0_9MICO|nr:hypothetical protein [Branchiibius hedensis]PWJ25673.1 hypothetical protein ATK17_1809 [Branchiibius hedensis]SSA34486.1 hypothetical protein SAMN04489750_1809 [Branchiibius hedensis]
MALLTSQIDGDGDPMLPVHPDGARWQFVMLFGDRMQAVADTATELLPLVVAGYDHIAADDIESAFLARFDHAAGVAAFVQHSALQAAIDGGYQLDDDVATTAMMSPKTDPLPGPVLGRAGVWGEPVPLVLVASHYAPYTELAAPSGDGVILVDPYTEKGYLAGLDQLGLVTFRELSLV